MRSGRGDDAEVIVLGGGAAGAAAAVALARAGRRTLLIEREAAPREKVCGEFLGADAALLLARLGLGPPAALGAVPVRRAWIAHRRRVAEVALPFAAWGLPRRLLDEALLGLAAEAGATVLRGRAARGATRDAARGGGGWTVRLADGTGLCAPRLVLATGKHELRGQARRTAGEGTVGLKLHLRLRHGDAPAPDGGVALLCCPGGGYAGLQPSADGLANLCLAVAPAVARGFGTRDSAALVAHVAAGSDLAARLLADAEAVPVHGGVAPLAVARIPYGFLHRDAAGAPADLYRIGDQFAVIPSFCGDGIAMALGGGLHAAAAIDAGVRAPDFHLAWRRRLARPMRWAGLAAMLHAGAPGALTGAARLAPGAIRLLARQTRVGGAASLEPRDGAFRPWRGGGGSRPTTDRRGGTGG